MKYLLLLMLFGCESTPKITTCYDCTNIDVVYFPDDAATKQDHQALKRAFKKCLMRGKCLVKFTVVEHGRYHAVCGSKEEKICKLEE